MTLSRRWSSVWVRWTTSRFASAWICAGVGGGAAVVTGVAGRRAGRAAAGFGACTLICGSCVAPGGVTVGDGWPACCAEATPTAAKSAAAELPSRNSYRYRTDPNMLPPTLDNDGTESWIVIPIKCDLDKDGTA